MGTGYTRNDTSNNIADGNVINASDLDGEFDAVQAAFNGTTGHSHDGTSGEGPQIAAAGIASNAVTTDKILNANVTLAKMAANSIDSDQYVDGSIDTVHIANDAVTGDKLANNIQIAGTLGVTGETTLATHLNMGDSDIIKLGADADLQIYHDGSNSRIDDAGTGRLIIRGNGGVSLEKYTGETLALFNADGASSLYYDNAAKLATTSTGIDVTGNVVVSGTVDGRDVATDGTKLDGIESGATADQTASEILTLIKTVDGSGSGLDADTLDGVSSGSFLRSDAAATKTNGHLSFSDNVKAVFGAGSDLQIYHDSSNSYIHDAGTGNLFIRGSNLILEDSAGNDYIECSDSGTGGTVSLKHEAVTKLATKSDGVDITGELQADSLDIDGAADISGQVNFHSNVVMDDNNKLIIGTGSDLQIYHNGSNSLIDHGGSGHLYIRQLTNDADIYIQNDNGSGGETNYIQCDGSAGTVILHYYGSQKLITKTDGVDIIGELQSDSLDVDGNADISGQLTMGGNVNLQDNDILQLGSSQDLQIYHDGSNSYIIDQGTGSLFIRGTNLVLEDASGNDYINMTDNGTGGTVTLYHNNVQILTTASDRIVVSGGVQATNGAFQGNSTDDKMVIGASQIDFYINNSNEFRMESDGDFHADGDVIAYSTTVSDERLKTDIEKIENATDKVSQLNGYTFTYKADGKKSAGVIAQEVEKVLPSAVSEKELPLKMDDGVAYKTVQYDQIIGLLIESIKELKQEINELKGA